MTTRTSTIEDLETGKDREFERIKQNFTTPPNGDDLSALEHTMDAMSILIRIVEPIAHYTEVQTSFRDLQSELQTFLIDHIDKVTLLQERIVSGPTRATSNDGVDTQRTVVPASNPRSSQLFNEDSHQAFDDDHPEHKLPKPTAVIKVDKAILDAHMRDLQLFLTMHMDNIRRLQESHHSPMPSKEHSPTSAHSHRSDKSDDSYTMVNMKIAVFTFTAILIMTFLILVRAIVGSKHRIPYSLAVFFSFLALASVIVGIFTARLGLPSWAEERRNSDKLSFYLQICEQLQLVATFLFIISICITLFIIFVSLAFPFVVLFLSAVGALVVFMSVHWEVAITFNNVIYLAKNIRRLNTVVDFVKYNRKPPTTANLL